MGVVEIPLTVIHDPAIMSPAEGAIDMLNYSAIRLPTQEWEHIVRLGTEQHAQELERELRTARTHIAELERKYTLTLAQLRRSGLPDDAGREAHEDYVEWSSLEGYAAELEVRLAGLRDIIGSPNAR